MGHENPSTTPDQPPVSVSGDAWPVLPLGLAALLLRTLGDHTWAYAVGAMIGAFGLVAAVVGLGVCVGALRRGADVGKAVWAGVLLLVGGFAVVHQLATAW
jgi:hypothetical protein